MPASTKPGPHRATALWRRVIDPALSETTLTSLSILNRLVRTRMLGGVGAGEGDLPGYPIRQQQPVRYPRVALPKDCHRISCERSKPRTKGCRNRA
jgi:hypothetical protein